MTHRQGLRRRCHDISIVDFLRVQGRLPKHHVGNHWTFDAWWDGDQNGHLEVYHNHGRNVEWWWKNYKNGGSGDIIELAKVIYNTNDELQAMSRILSCEAATATISHENEDDTPKGSAITFTGARPMESEANIEYAKGRGISPETAKLFMCDVFFKFATCPKRTLAIGMKNDSGGYATRTYTSKYSVGTADITTFRYTNTGKWVVFEGMFDFLAYWEHHKAHTDMLHQCNYIVLNSTSNIKRAILALRGASIIHALTDNDKAGNKAVESLKTAFGNIVKDERHLLGAHNDYNEYFKSLQTL